MILAIRSYKHDQCSVPNFPLFLFVQFYERIPEQVKGLHKAKEKLEDHARLMKKAQFPLSLLEEAKLSVTLVNQRLATVPQDNT